MKFMKLGSKPDTFFTADSVRSVSSEISSDLVIQVKGTTYLLHKFPLLSKCALLQKLYSNTSLSTSPPDDSIIQLPDFPGGTDSFELCAKFCYGITVTFSAHNIVAARCAAEYLQMTEETEKGNLIHKLEVFFTSCILHGWKDSIVTLQSTKLSSSFAVWAEDLGITSRCIEALAVKVLSKPSKVSLSHSQSRRVREDSVLPCKESNDTTTTATATTNVEDMKQKGWWGEDMSDLGIDIYWRTMIAIKSGGKVASSLIGEALQIYAYRWFPTRQTVRMDPNSSSLLSQEEKSRSAKNRLLLESIVSLLPAEKGAVPCSFLLKLLKAANKLGASSSSKSELVRRVGIQLEEASVRDLLISAPLSSGSSETRMKYDVDLVLNVVEQFMAQGGKTPPSSPPRVRQQQQQQQSGRVERRRRSRSAENIDMMLMEGRRSSSSSATHGAKLKVARLVDRYLREIGSDPNLPLGKMIGVAESVPDFARVDHDDLYRAIDTYLKAHPELNKSERKRLCRILDCRKLSVEACMDAAQNELLPLRVVVQVLFFEHARAAAKSGGGGMNKVSDLPANIKALLGSAAATAQDEEVLLSRVPKPPPMHMHMRSGTTLMAEDQWSISGVNNNKSSSSPMSRSSSKVSTLKTKLDEVEDGSLKTKSMMPTKPKRMLTRLMSINGRSGTEKHA